MAEETQTARRVTPEEVMEKLQPIVDPEIMLSIVDLGLVYDVHVDEANMVVVTITLTTPACPLGPVLFAQIEDAVMGIEGVKDVDVELTFTPRWDPRTMASDEIKMQLGIW
jgi:metal-sulfur cluster biosynthetic enzyme